VRILIYGLSFSPELVGVGKYTGEMAEWLAGRGHEVRAVTAPPSYPHWKVAQGFSPWRYSCEDHVLASRAGRHGRLTVLRCPLWVPPQPSPGKRIVHLVSFALASLPAMLRQVFWQPEVVLAVEPTLFCLPAAWLTGRLCGARTWLHVQDFEADAAFEVGQLKPVELRFVVAWLEEKGMAGFDRVSTISAKMLSRLTLKGVPEEACRLFPNWVDTDAIFPLPQPSPLRRELGIPDGEMVALYAGTMAGKQGLEILAEAAGKLAGRAGLRFVFCGEGPGKARLAELTSQMANVQWIPLQPLDRLNHLLNLADIHLLPQKADAADLVMPSKLTGMLASGRPVIATSRRDTQLAHAVEGRGIVVDPGNAAAFCQAIGQLADDADLRQRLGRKAREYAVSELKKETILSGLEQELLRLAGS